MAFIGKHQAAAKKSKKADIMVTHNKGRLGLTFSNGFMKPTTYIDVLVGTEEDKGLLKIELGGGVQVTPIGKKQKTCSWSAVRAAAKNNLTDLKRFPAKIVEKGDDYIVVSTLEETE